MCHSEKRHIMSGSYGPLYRRDNMRIDMKDVYRDRIKEIDRQIAKAVANKKWTEKAKLEAEKVNLQERIN